MVPHKGKKSAKIASQEMTSARMKEIARKLHISLPKLNAQLDKIRASKNVSPETRQITFGPINPKGSGPRPIGPRIRGSRRH